MDPSQNQAVETFMSFTGSSPGLALQAILAHGGDLNAAINAFFNEGEDSVLQRQADDARRADWMEEDEPSHLEPLRPLVPQPVNPNLSSWGSLNTEMVRGRGIGGIAAPQFPFRGSVPVVSHPREVREIPSDWRDEETPIRPHSGPFIEEVPSTQVGLLASESQEHIIVEDDEDPPSTASSIFRASGETTGRQNLGRNTVYEGDQPLNRRSSAPFGEGHTLLNEDGNDIEEEMLRVAIEASKKEAEAASRRRSNYSEGTMQIEDDDLAIAVSLSIQTAEHERALREHGEETGSQEGIMQEEDEGNYIFSEDIRRLASLKRHGSTYAIDNTRTETETSNRLLPNGEMHVRKLGSGSSSATSSPEEAEELVEQPLLRRRSTRRVGTTATLPVAGSNLVSQEIDTPQPESSGFASLPDNEYNPSGLPQPNGDTLQNDEWGGISSEEHEEAVMLEAVFGTLPENAAMRFRYPTVSDSLLHDVTQGYARPVRPLSPSVVAQRLLREQQDDEYRASLEADREKETKALLEAEDRRLKEAEAAAAAGAAEQLRINEEQSRLRAEEELERLLASKTAALPSEPAVEDESAVTLLVRMPDGSRRGRRFQNLEKLQCLFDFIDVGGGVKPGSYRLVRQYPRRAFTHAEHGLSFSDLGLNSKLEALFLELI